MGRSFPQIMTALRKEKGLSQKEAAEQLGVSQALLSHYEKGIRGCGLPFLVRAAEFYGVTVDYLLGRSRRQEESPVEKGGSEPVPDALQALFKLAEQTGGAAGAEDARRYFALAVYRYLHVLSAQEPSLAALFGSEGEARRSLCLAKMLMLETARLIRGGSAASQTEPKPPRRENRQMDGALKKAIELAKAQLEPDAAGQE